MEFYIVEAVLGAFMFGIGGTLFKWNAQNQADDNYFFLSLYGVGAACFFIYCYDILDEIGGLLFFVMAALVGLGSAGGNFTFSYGMRLGPAGLTAAFAKANIIIVILISAFYYGEAISNLEALGIVFFFAAMLAVNIKMKGSEKSTSGMWFLTMIVCIILLAFRNGGLKVVNELELSGNLIVAFAYLFCAAYFAAVIAKNKNKPWTAKASKAKTMMIGAMTGLVSFGGLYFYVSALEKGPGSIVVTIFSLDMFFILLMSYLIFGERLNRNQRIGFILSAIGLTLIGLK